MKDFGTCAEEKGANVIICYDGDFPVLSRVLAVKGAEFIVRPSTLLCSFEIWEMTNRARAYDLRGHSSASSKPL